MKKIKVKWGFVIGLLVSFCFLGFGAVVLLTWNISQTLPPVSKLREYSPAVPARVLDRNGKILMELGTENRDLVIYKDIPKVLIQAVISAEDDRFYEHNGVDFPGVFRATINNIKAGRVIQGGSTITQQVAKSLLLTNEKTFTRKIKDFLLAINIEREFSKEEILYLYLNQVYLGSGYYGIKAATKGYFDKELSQITIAESALIAGLLSAPGRYSPLVNPKYAKTRQNYVLEQMYNKNRITNEEYEKARSEEVKLRIAPESALKAPYFSEWIRQSMVAVVGEKQFLTDGLQITTTLDLELQTSAEKSAQAGIKEIDRRQGFLGPINHVPPEELLKKELDLALNIAQEFSTYKSFLSDGSLRDQYDFTNKEKNDFQSTVLSYYQSSDLISKQFQTPLMASPYYDVRTLSFLREKKKYPAVVLKINDRLKLIFATIGGIVGVIPFDGFKWAHKRKISEETTYAYVQQEKPTTILKEGDIIDVTIDSIAPIPLVSKIQNSNLKSLSPDLKTQLVDSKFIIFNLEQSPIVQGAVVAMDPHTGEILALVGGNDFAKSKFNRAIQSLRQAGSAVKPLIYATALENGFTPASILLDTPQSLSGVDNVSSWKPKNYDGEFKGLITLRTSLQESRNVSTINLLQHLKIEKVLEFIKRLSIKSKIPNDMSIALGSFGISLLDLTKAYCIFPNGGKKIKEKKIISIFDRNGKSRQELVDRVNNLISLDNPTAEVIANEEEMMGDEDLASNKESEADLNKTENATSEMGVKVTKSGSDQTPNTNDSANNVDSADANKNKNTDAKNDNNSEEQVEQIHKKGIDFLSGLKGEQVFDARLAFIMDSLLKGVIQAGTAQDAKSLGPIFAGKTGTTSSYVDAWFVGFSNKLVVGVWTGFDDNTTLGFGETGGYAALPIWKMIMESSFGKYNHTDFQAPPGIVQLLVDKKTGRLLKKSVSDAIHEYFVSGTQPGGTFDQNDQVDDVKTPILDEEDYWSQQ